MYMGYLFEQFKTSFSIAPIALLKSCSEVGKNKSLNRFMSSKYFLAAFNLRVCVHRIDSFSRLRQHGYSCPYIGEDVERIDPVDADS